MELLRALGVLAEPPTRETGRIAALLNVAPLPTAADYTDLFLLQLYPYASVYLGAEGMLGGAARDRIAGTWRAVGATPPAEPDHLAVLLAAHARAIELETAEEDRERREARRRLRATLAWEHLLSWIGVYLAKVEEIAAPSYKEWGALLKEALVAEARELGAPDVLPLALREAGEVGVELDALETVLVPVQSGIVVTRADLKRCARALGLGTRRGERRYILKSLLEQDAPRTTEWLADEAERWAGRHRQDRQWLADIATWWAARAQATADRLRARLASSPA